MYVDGFVIPVPNDKRDAYRELARKSWEVFKELGAIRQVECWADDVPDGKVTDFRRSVKAEAGETIVFAWIEYPSREVRDEVNRKIIEDPRMEAMMKDGIPFDGQRMIFGGFRPMLDEHR